MKILITNDDGIGGEGLKVLTRFAKTLGDVTVIAPKTEQSGKSHAINIHSPFEVKQVDYMDGVRAFTVDSTPADCVRVATALLNEKFDLVLSGINKGFNVGEDIVYSGTCGAIFEAAYTKTNAIAISTEPTTFDDAEAALPRVFDYIEKNRLLDVCGLYNINIPLEPGEIRITREGGAYFRDTYISKGNDMYLADGYSAYEKTADLTLDTNATFSGFISITPLTVDRTNQSAFDKLK
ncbi:MAG: 5'/3'-nucleotidase SurE [Clostridiales bacterium]|nr:5'/3'-nucleotidase SurE [Clostridiales bacterium]